MEQSYKPRGYNSVSAYLVAEGAQRVIDFLAATFGAKTLRRFDRPDGKVMHAEVMIDDTVVMVADVPPGAAARPLDLHVYVPDVDATYRLALAAGGVSVQEPASKGGGDPDRRDGVKDPAGNTWWVATQGG